MTAAGREPIRVARIIARLNIGGPGDPGDHAHRAAASRWLRDAADPRPRGAARGLDGRSRRRARRAARCGSRAWAASSAAATSLAFVRLVRELRRFRPDIVHTHAAKAGTLGRLAALRAAAAAARRVTVHTFHGHSLTGYFSPRKAALFTAHRARPRAPHDAPRSRSPRRCATTSCASASRRRSASRSSALGFDLSRFDVDDAERDARGAAAARAARHPAPTRGRDADRAARPDQARRPLPRDRAASWRREPTTSGSSSSATASCASSCSATARSPSDVVWAGFRRDVPDVCFASDVVVLTSDNEGTPVSLIEAQAAGVPVVSTRVGGAAAVVAPGAGALVGEPATIAALRERRARRPGARRRRRGDPRARTSCRRSRSTASSTTSTSCTAGCWAPLTR